MVVVIGKTESRELNKDSVDLTDRAFSLALGMFGGEDGLKVIREVPHNFYMRQNVGLGRGTFIVFYAFPEGVEIKVNDPKYFDIAMQFAQRCETVLSREIALRKNYEKKSNI